MDYEVAMEKLNSFQSPNEIAEYLEGQGIKGYRSKADSCAVSVYVRQECGFTMNDVITFGDYGNGTATTATPKGSFQHGSSVSEFIHDFDNGQYPNLVKES